MKLHSRHKYDISFIADEDINSATMKMIQSACMRKLKFRYRPEAIRRINAILDDGVAKRDSDFGIYRCRCCGGWHFTSNASMLDDFDEKIKKLKGGKHRQKRSRLNILKAFSDKGYFLPVIHLRRKDIRAKSRKSSRYNNGIKENTNELLPYQSPPPHLRKRRHDRRPHS